MNPGKLFEQDFQNSVPPAAYVYRLKDCPAWVNQCECPGGASPRFTPSNDYDFALFWHGHFWALELKSTKNPSIRFDALRTNQWNGLLFAQTHDNMHAGVLVNFRTEGETWFIGISQWEYQSLNIGKKSMNIKDIRDLGVRMPGKVRRVRWQWDVLAWMKEYLP